MAEVLTTAAKSKKMIKSEIIQYVSIVFMLLGLFIRNALNVDFSVIILLGIMIIPILFGNDDNLWSTVIACIPLSKGFQYKYALFIAFLVFIIRKRGMFKISSSGILILIMMVWELLHFFIGSFSLNDYFRCFAELLIVFIITCANMENINYKLVFRSLAISTVGVCFIILFIQMKNTTLQSLFEVHRYAFRFGAGNEDMLNFGLNYNANGLGIICCQTITVLLILYSRAEHNFFDIVMLFLSIVFGFLTLSRTYVVCLIFVFTCFFVFSSHNARTKVKDLKKIIGIAVLGMLLMLIFLPNVMENLLIRFADSDIFNGRDALFFFYTKHIVSSPFYFLFGIGLQDLSVKLQSIYHEPIAVCHNGLQEVWVVWGVVGVLLMGVFLLSVIVNAKKMPGKIECQQYVPFFLLLLCTSVGQFVRSGTELLSLALIYVCLCIRNNKLNSVQ